MLGQFYTLSDLATISENHMYSQLMCRTWLQDLAPTPWKAIALSVPLWGLIIGQIGHDWALFTIQTDLPKYMKSVMHFTVAQVSFYFVILNILLSRYHTCAIRPLICCD